MFKKSLKLIVNNPFFFQKNCFAVPRHAVGGLLEDQYPVFCGGSNVGWDNANGYEQGCYMMDDSVAFQVFTVSCRMYLLFLERIQI